MILYEYPLQERIRTYLRLEHLLQRLDALVPRDTALAHHFALVTLFEVLDVAARADLKTDLLKDLDKQKQVLNGYRGNPNISETTLDNVVAHLDRCFEALNAQVGKVGNVLAENDFLNSVKSRVAIPGGTCEFDLPAYYAWQHKSPDVRQADLKGWVAQLDPMSAGVRQLLHMLRESGTPQKIMATNGQYQLHLPQGRTFQLLRLRIDPALDLVPEISGNKLLVSVRLMRMGEDMRLHPQREDAGFDLSLCA